MIGAAFVAAVVLAIAAAPASATTWHHTWSRLHFPAREADAGSMPSRTITLKGRYRWRSFIAHAAHTNQPTVDTRTPRLYGRYLWSDGLRAVNGMYQRISTLTNLRTGGKIHLDHTAVVGAFGDGRYHWGSTLENVRARR
jgi:hypothetical protein